jgi:hypothetical protein
MSRTNGQFQMKTPFSDGLVHFNAMNFAVLSGAAPLTRNAKGDISLNAGNTQVCVFGLPLSALIQRLGQLPFLQEQFGTAAGVAGPTTVANTSDPDGNVLIPYVPPMTKATMETVTGGEAGFVPKGVQINDVTLHYQIGTANLTTHTLGLSKTVYPVSGTPGALVVTDVIANAANGLATAFNANPQSTKIAVASPVFTVNDLASLLLEVDATTPGTGTYRLYGASIHVSFNFN